MKQYQFLTPFKLPNGVTLKNRVVIPPMTELLALEDGTVSLNELDYLNKRSEGVGMFISPVANVNELGKGFKGELSAADDRITRPHNLLEYVQKVEYLLGYRLKGSEELLGIEYIIGGIGSTFRKSAMLEVGGYDTDSITEDIDFTMKMIDHFGNSNRQFGYADDVIAYTPPVSRFSQLLKQRYRWKQGRFKALFKHRRVIFNRDAKYTFSLAYWKLPKVFFEEFLMLIDPLLLLWIIGIIHHFADFSTIFAIFGLYYLFAMATFIPEELKFWERIRLMMVAPLAYLILYVINIVDWISLMRCLFNMKRIANNEDKTAKWQHVDR